MKKLLGDVGSGRWLTSPSTTHTWTTTPNPVWECGAMCVEGEPNPSERALPSNWSCCGQTPGQPLTTLNSNYIIRDRLLKLSEKKCDRNGNFSELLIDALEQKNKSLEPDVTAIFPGHPHPGLGSAGPCGVQERLHLAATHSEGESLRGRPCSAGTQGHLGHLSLAPHGGPAATQRGGRLPLLPESAWKFRGALPTAGSVEMGGFNVFQASETLIICCVANIDPECIVHWLLVHWLPVSCVINKSMNLQSLFDLKHMRWVVFPHDTYDLSLHWFRGLRPTEEDTGPCVHK